MKRITIIATLIILMSCSTSKNLTEDDILGKYVWLEFEGWPRSFELKKEGVFEYIWVTGVKRGTTIGTWTMEGSIIKLNSEMQPQMNFENYFDILDMEHGITDSLTLEVLDFHNNPICFAQCILLKDKVILERTSTNINGIAKLSKVNSDILIIRYNVYETIRIKVDSNVSKYLLRMKDKDCYQYFTDKEMIYRKKRLYDPYIKTGKHIKKNYYEREENESSKMEIDTFNPTIKTKNN